MVPAGNTNDIAHQYYTYLWQVYEASIPAPRTTILWSGPFYIALFVIVLVLFLYLYTKYANRVHRNRGEMYGVMSFAGSILERIGPVSVFSYFIWLVQILWSVNYIIAAIQHSYIYIAVIH